MTLTPYNFQRLTGLRSYGHPVELEHPFGRALIVELLGCSYYNETVRYYVLAREFESQA